MVVFGIRPTGPETGYGYLEVAESNSEPQPLKSFVEKPDRATAEKYLAEGRYYWNSGMFCFTAGVMAQNMAALRALSTEGIQRGHMTLHARNIAITAGATGSDIDRVAKAIVAVGDVSVAQAKRLLEADNMSMQLAVNSIPHHHDSRCVTSMHGASAWWTA